MKKTNYDNLFSGRLNFNLLIVYLKEREMNFERKIFGRTPYPTPMEFQTLNPLIFTFFQRNIRMCQWGKE
jgi:hypothetical protein